MKNNIKKNLDLIGNTPLIEVGLGLPNTKVLVKLESFNLTGSIKDRMALYMIRQAKKKGRLKKGSTIVEATTGNTGIAFAALAKILGYKMIAIMPEDMSLERRKILKLYGAKIILTPQENGPKGAIAKRDQLARSIPNAWIPDQFSNPDNSLAYEQGIAKEILNQFSGKIDYFIHGIGTGGTLMGIAKVLKQKMPEVKIVAVEPQESAVLSGGKPGKHNIQGIGEGFIPELVTTSLIDQIIQVSTKEAIRETKNLMTSHGLFVGFSSGANIAAVKRLIKGSRKKITILTIFADSGNRYLSIL